jgi:hypothetical protein
MNSVKEAAAKPWFVARKSIVKPDQEVSSAIFKSELKPQLQKMLLLR